jgi:nitrate reductase NapAB chaperone NapD
MDRCIWESKKLDKINKIIEKLNQVYSNEIYCINENGCLVFRNKNENDHQYIANFFVVPTHWTYCYYGETLDNSDGLAITVYHKFDDKKYVKLSLNLKYVDIENGNWVNSKDLESFYDFPIQSNYRFLRSALKLATKRIKSKNVKLFRGEEWFDGWEAKHHIKQYYKDFSVNQVYLRDVTERDSLEKDAMEYVKSVNEYINLNKLTNFNTIPENEVNNIGWHGDAENQTIYLVPKKLNDWIKKHSSNISTSMNMINSHLVYKEILLQKTESKGRKRIDILKTVYPRHKEHVYVIIREKFDSLLSNRTQT